MFKPSQVFFIKESLNYKLGQELFDMFSKDEKISVDIVNSSRITGIKGEDIKEKYNNAKKTLVVAVKKTLKFENCKPSAHYQLPLVSGCMGKCEYCYLNTRLGNSNYIKIYVNTEDIINKAKEYIEERLPEETIFEAAATSDPIPVEGYTNSLKKIIEFFGKEEKGRLRFVTKYPYVDSLLDINHNGHTEIRFSLNTDTVINDYEHSTADSKNRIKALVKVTKAGYKSGVLIAPVFLYDRWKEEYLKLLKDLKEELEKENVTAELTFEVITHRYTAAAKNRILEFYPETTLPMSEEDRKFKYGQFGYGKYIYKPEDMEDVKEFFKENISEIFPNGKILYII